MITSTVSFDSFGYNVIGLELRI